MPVQAALDSGWTDAGLWSLLECKIALYCWKRTTPLKLFKLVKNWINTSFLFLILEIDEKDINLFWHKQKDFLDIKQNLW